MRGATSLGVFRRHTDSYFATFPKGSTPAGSVVPFSGGAGHVIWVHVPVFPKLVLWFHRPRSSSNCGNYLYVALDRARKSRCSLKSTMESKVGPCSGFAFLVSRSAALTLSMPSALAAR
jgi:hypothetical protein